MWTATTIGFFSVVRDRQTKGGVLVRARAKADIWNLYRRFSTAYKNGKGKRYKMTRPKADEHRDYRWRVAMRKTDWARIVYRLTMEIDYCNFKDEVHKRPDQSNKHSAYMSVWSALYRVQRMEDPDYRPDGQTYFGGLETSWQRELDYAIADEERPAMQLSPFTFKATKEAQERAEIDRKVKYLLGGKTEDKETEDKDNGN